MTHAYTTVFVTSTFPYPKEDRQPFHLFEGSGPKNMEPQTDEACHKHMQASSLSWFEPIQMNESYIIKLLNDFGGGAKGGIARDDGNHEFPGQSL